MTDQINTALAHMNKSNFRFQFKLTDKDNQYIAGQGHAWHTKKGQLQLRAGL
jgi:hypothetical protein